MATQTPNHEYTAYEVGDAPPWSHASLIRALDTDVEIRDTSSNRLDYQPKAGAKFFALDTGRIHIGTGTAWRHLGSVVNPDDFVAQSDLDAHTQDTTNPHNVTADQVGALSSDALDAHVADTENPHSVTAAQVDAPTTAAFNDHVSDVGNPHGVTAAQVDAPTTAAFTTHADDAAAHHTRPSAGTGLDEDAEGAFNFNIVASGSVTLTDGIETVDTGVSTTETATFDPALGPQTADADVAADVRADSGTGTYVVDIQETDTAIGAVDVDYDIIRIR